MRKRIKLSWNSELYSHSAYKNDYELLPPHPPPPTMTRCPTQLYEEMTEPVMGICGELNQQGDTLSESSGIQVETLVGKEEFSFSVGKRQVN